MYIDEEWQHEGDNFGVHTHLFLYPHNADSQIKRHNVEDDRVHNEHKCEDHYH